MLVVNKIYCGRCQEVMKDISSDSVDLTVTSPPYEDIRKYDSFRYSRDFDLLAIAKQLYKVTRPGGILVWVVADKTTDFCESLVSFKQAILFVEEVGFKLVDTMIYEKVAGPEYDMKLHNRYYPASEYMFIFSKGKPTTFNPIYDVPRWHPGEKLGRIKRVRVGYEHKGKQEAHLVTKTSVRTTGFKTAKKFRLRGNVWRYHPTKRVDQFSRRHKGVFPMDLANDHIRSWSNKGDLVLDPMCGAGTTCKEAALNGRDFIGIDISLKYCKLAAKRISVFGIDRFLSIHRTGRKKIRRRI